MDKLIITQIGYSAHEIELDRERLTIGRDAGNDLSLEDKFVSARHAVIVSVLGDAFLEDLGSTNGTRVNGKPVAKCTLADGDVIEMGAYVLHYCASDRAGATAATALFAASPVVAKPARATVGAQAEIAKHDNLAGDKLEIL